MTRRQFLRSAAIATAAAPAVPAAISRAAEPAIVRPSDFDCPLKVWVCFSNPPSDSDHWVYREWMTGDAPKPDTAVQRYTSEIPA